MINIVIPMAGEGSRFKNAGYARPKPFIDVAGKLMIERVLDNLNYHDASFYLICRSEHILNDKQFIDKIKSQYNVVFIPIQLLTQGSACTVLFARKFINNGIPLMIANSDQLVDTNIGDFIEDCKKRKLDGSIMTFIDNNKDPKWSFAKINADNLVIETKEKTPISQYATVGIYLYSKGSYFVDAAIDMIINEDRVKNEFYTCPTYNYLIREGLKIGIFNIEQEMMHGLGTPEDLVSYIKTKQNK